MTTSTSVLSAYGKKHIVNFIGVFPLDKLPIHLVKNSKFIVNTDTHNLPGKHWIAVSYEKGGIIYAFDPFGIFYPTCLITYLSHKPRARIVLNRKMYQHPMEKSCGWYCLRFLQGVYKHDS